MSEFDPILQATLTPVALISGVGLLLLSMVNRYNHALDRTRQLLKERQQKHDGKRTTLEQSIQILYARCKIMKNAILCTTISIFFSGSIIFLTALEGLMGIVCSTVKGIFLLLSVGLIVGATVLFVVDVLYSLHAIRIDIEM
jgi:uncharacterized protein DUF2721